MNIIINGIFGRMGGMVAETAAEDADIHLICGFDSATPETPFVFRGAEIPTYASYTGDADGSNTTAEVIIEGPHI